MHIRLLTTCRPERFRGCEEPHVSVPVTGRTTMSELRQSIQFDLAHGFVYGYTLEAKLMGRNIELDADLARYADRLNYAAFAAVNRLRMTEGQRAPFPHLAPYAQDTFAYFKFDLEL